MLGRRWLGAMLLGALLGGVAVASPAGVGSAPHPPAADGLELVGCAVAPSAPRRAPAALMPGQGDWVAGVPVTLQVTVRNGAASAAEPAAVRVLAYRAGSLRVSSSACLPALPARAERVVQVRLRLDLCGPWTLLACVDASDSEQPSPAGRRRRALVVEVAPPLQDLELAEPLQAAP